MALLGGDLMFMEHYNVKIWSWAAIYQSCCYTSISFDTV